MSPGRIGESRQSRRSRRRSSSSSTDVDVVVLCDGGGKAQGEAKYRLNGSIPNPPLLLSSALRASSFVECN